jgi:hypothetical protein
MKLLGIGSLATLAMLIIAGVVAAKSTDKMAEPMAMGAMNSAPEEKDAVCRRMLLVHGKTI